MTNYTVGNPFSQFIKWERVGQNFFNPNINRRVFRLELIERFLSLQHGNRKKCLSISLSLSLSTWMNFQSPLGKIYISSNYTFFVFMYIYIYIIIGVLKKSSLAIIFLISSAWGMTFYPVFVVSFCTTTMAIGYFTNLKRDYWVVILADAAGIRLMRGPNKEGKLSPVEALD